ncbi:MAG: alpha/beta fold hydrolase [Colwellia sp.]|nr:alpha/beta fold hydrolase [Colwellia sp.]
MKIPQLSLAGILLTTGISACGSGSSNTSKPATTLPAAPSVNITAQTTIKRLDNFVLTATASDVNNDISNYLWQQLDGPGTVTLAANNALTTPVTFPKVVGKYTFQLTVSDAQSLSTSKSIEVNVTNTALLNWQDCDLSNVAGKRLGADCLHHNVPLEWSTSDSDKIENLVIRYLAPQQPAKGKVWLLDGGPGGNSQWAMQPEYQQIFNADEWDIYIPIHRGVEGPTKLHCNNGINLPTSECFNDLMTEYDGKLAAFNTENAAYDLADIIALASETGEKDIIFGISYGTFLAQKYLQQQEAESETAQIDGLILDGSTPLDFQAIEMADNYDLIGERVLQVCYENEFCRAQLDGDPLAFLDQTLAKLALGECLIGGDEENILTVNIAKTLIDLALTDFKDTVPGIIKMLNRCNSNDQSAFGHAYQLFNEPDEESNLAFSGYDNKLVLANVLVTNMHRPTMSKFEFEQHLNTLRFTSVNSQPFYNVTEVWLLDAKPLNSTLPATSVPLLMIHGGLDPQTTDIMAEQVFNDYAGNQKTLVIFPTFEHGVFSKDQIANPNCVANIIQAFMLQPEQNVDSQCAADTFPVDVAVESDYVQSIFENIFGISSPW